MSNRKWIQTYTGIHINPLNAKIEEINIEDIAVSLSRLCRYTGHTRNFYSVAQHSMIVSAVAMKELGTEYGLQALLHDATEAYMNDIARPLKHQKFYAQYRKYEDKLYTVIAKVFDLPEKIDPRIKEIDGRVGAQEARVLMNANESWGILISDKAPMPDLNLFIGCELLPNNAREQFMTAYSDVSSK